MSKKNVTGLEAFKKLENIDNRYLTEADSFISLTESEAELVAEKRSLRDRFAFTQTGWFAAAASAVVALAAVVFIVRAGDGPNTVRRPEHGFTPASNVGESVNAVSEDETVLTAELPEDVCSGIYAYGKNDKYWNDLTDEEQAQARKVHVKQDCHIYSGVGGFCVVCGVADDPHIHVYNESTGTCLICGLVDTATDALRSRPDGWEGLSDVEKAAIQAELASIGNDALDPRAQHKIAAKEEWRKNHPQEAEATVTRTWDDLTDEEKAQIEEILRNQHLHVYDKNGGACIICGQKDGSYEMLREHLPCNHRMTAEEQEKAALIAAYLDDLGIAYGYVAYNDEGIVVTTPKGAYPDTHYGRIQLELQGDRIAAALVGKNMPVKEMAWWIFNENEYGFLSMQTCHSGEFIAPPITHNAYREWTDEELLAVVSGVFDDELADDWSVRFAQMEDKEWLSICFEIDETMTVDGDRLSLLMNEVWRRMDKSVAMISVYFNYPGDTDTRADFFIDYINTYAGCGTNGKNIGGWSQPSIPTYE